MGFFLFFSLFLPISSITPKPPVYIPSWLFFLGLSLLMSVMLFFNGIFASSFLLFPDPRALIKGVSFRLFAWLIAPASIDGNFHSPEG